MNLQKSSHRNSWNSLDFSEMKCQDRGHQVTHFAIKQCECIVISKDFSYNHALFGLVSYNDPYKKDIGRPTP